MTCCCLVGVVLAVMAVFALVLPFVGVAWVMRGSPVGKQLYAAPTTQSPAGQPVGVTRRVLPCGPCEAPMLRLHRKSNGMWCARLESSVARDVRFVRQCRQSGIEPILARTDVRSPGIVMGAAHDTSVRLGYRAVRPKWLFSNIATYRATQRVVVSVEPSASLASPTMNMPSSALVSQ